jgi:hypothetical protein
MEKFEYIKKIKRNIIFNQVLQSKKSREIVKDGNINTLRQMYLDGDILLEIYIKNSYRFCLLRLIKKGCGIRKLFRFR